VTVTNELFEAIPADVVHICARMRERNKRGWVVGGCVRDLLRGAAAKDWDIATDARPHEVKHMFDRVIPTGIDHGTVTVLLRGEPYEVTTLRGDGDYSDGRRPNEVTYLDDIEEDLARRDFTFNAIAIDPIERKLIDPFGGQDDLAAGLLRAVGDPVRRFTEDGLRILRGARFAATLGCDIEETTLAAMSQPDVLDTFRKVAPERVQAEWLKAMKAERPSIAFAIMRTTGMLAISCPELVACGDRAHNQDINVWQHTMETLDACPHDVVLRLAALLHDLGKGHEQPAHSHTPGHHADSGATLAEAVLRRLKFSNEHRKRIVELVRQHFVEYRSDWSDAEVRRWLQRVTPDGARAIIELGLADTKAGGRAFPQGVESVHELRQRAEQQLSQGVALTTRELAIDGGRLIRELGLKPGRVIGQTLAALLEAVLDDPDRNDPDQLLAIATKLVAATQANDTTPT